MAVRGRVNAKSSGHSKLVSAPLSSRWRRPVLTAAAVAGLFAASCSTGSTPGGLSTSTVPAATTTLPDGCVTHPNGVVGCVVVGRPLRRRRRRGLLVPADDGGDRRPDALLEYASVASFSELALQLMAMGAPSALVARCHRAALDEVRHATAFDGLDGCEGTAFGAVPHLLGRRIGSRRRGRRHNLARIAVESYLDGWVNEGAAAAELEERASRAVGPEERQLLQRMAADERRHRDLGRDVVLWCFEEEPGAVGRALARVS